MHEQNETISKERKMLVFFELQRQIIELKNSLKVFNRLDQAKEKISMKHKTDNFKLFRNKKIVFKRVGGSLRNLRTLSRR